jgi:hypothetical protein
MDYQTGTPPLPAEYYRRHSARVRQLASEATTPALREHLLDVVAQYDRLAERVDAATLQAEPAAWGDDRPRGKHRQEDFEMAAHKFAVGQVVRFTPDRAERDQVNQGQRQFKIVRLLPEAASVFQYRVKSQLDGHERVVREDQLVRF